MHVYAYICVCMPIYSSVSIHACLSTRAYGQRGLGGERVDTVECCTLSPLPQHSNHHPNNTPLFCSL